MILDHIDGILLDDEDAESHYEATTALNRLAEGLYWINSQVSEIERQAQAEAAPNRTEIAVIGGILEDKPMGLLSCAFQCYAVSACNYANLVGSRNGKLQKQGTTSGR